MIDWKLAPEGAVAVGQRKDALAFTDEDDHVFLNGHWGISMGWKTIAKRPAFAESITKTPTQPKTVADVVDAFNGVWPESKYVTAWWDSSAGQILLGDNVTSDTICTREQFEDYVNASEIGKILESRDEQEGEKWAHIYSGVECRIKIDSPDCDGYLVVITKAGRYLFCKPGELKPIKPTISTKEYDMLAKYAAALNVDPAQFEQYMSDNYESQLKD